MKNILSAVLLFCFFGMGTSVFGQGHLSVIEKLLPCNLNSNYILYLQAAPPTSACVDNSIQILSSTANVNIHDCGAGVRTGFAHANNNSPTGWAYCIEVKAANMSSPIRVRELVYTPNCATLSHYNRTRITPKVRKQPTAIIDLEITGSDLCSGELELQAHHASITHHEYDWYMNNVYINTTTSATTSFNLGNNINTNFSLTVAASNGCTSTAYSENFTVKEPKTMMQPSINLPAQYCDGTKNEFTVNNPTLGIEYKWSFIPDSPAIQTKQGLDMISFSPNFGTTNVSGVGQTTNYTIELYFKTNCSLGWVLADKINVDPVTYSSNCSGSGSKVAYQPTTSTKTNTKKEHTIEGGVNKNTKVKANGTNSSAFSSINEQGVFTTAYPNPTTGKVALKNSTEAIQNVFVYDVTGTLVAQQLEVGNTTTTIDLGDLPNGMYLVTVQGKANNENIKVIKH